MPKRKVNSNDARNEDDVAPSWHSSHVKIKQGYLSLSQFLISHFSSSECYEEHGIPEEIYETSAAMDGSSCQNLFGCGVCVGLIITGNTFCIYET